MLYHGKSLVPGRNTVVRNAKLYRMNRWMEDCGKNTLLYKKNVLQGWNTVERIQYF